MKPTLLILAAGMGSRYGGLKQLDGLGPNAETIMDYSVFDAIRAGFGRVVFVIRHDFEKDFEEKVLSRYRDRIPVDVVFQSIDNLPQGMTPPADRTRPWGTGQAVLTGKNAINEPFAVINADDFYGADAFRVMAEYLSTIDSRPGHYCMVAFNLGNTMTRNGSVSRGVCTVDKASHLRSIVERRDISYAANNDIHFLDEESNEYRSLDASTPVSMNLWGFAPQFFPLCEREFITFLQKYGNDPKREFYIPSVVDMLIANKEVTVDVLRTSSQWFGVTYASDRDNVIAKLADMHKSGQYPTPLFQ